MLDSPRLEWMEVPGRPEVFALQAARILIGRRSDADVVFSHRLTSRQHAQVIREAESWFVVDLQSTHGTWVNGRRVARHQLKPKDRIRLGGREGVEIVFLTGEPSETTNSSGQNLPEGVGNPGELPIEVFDQHRSSVLSDRAQLFKDLSLPFYGANRPGANVLTRATWFVLATRNALRTQCHL
jgi:hypothetical protein